MTVAAAVMGGGGWLNRASSWVRGVGSAPGVSSSLERASTSSTSAALGREVSSALPTRLPPADYRGLRGQADQFRFISSITSAQGQQQPARWDPCQPIAYRINPGGMRADDVVQVRQALQRISVASGLQFRYLGLTSYVWTSQPKQGQAPADAALTFSFAQPGDGPGRSDLLGSQRVVGVGGPIWQTSAQGQRIVAAHVVMNSHVISALPSARSSGARLSAYMHELGHAVGLDHVNSPTQLMYPTLQTQLPAVFGAGDVAGLRRVGAAGGCLAP